MKSYKELIVWQKSMKMVKEIYVLTSRFPDEEKFGLISQMRRAVVSIPSNIAEGWGCSTTGSYIQFLRISRGSLYELETQLELSKDLGYIKNSDDVENVFVEISKMLNTLMKKLENAGTSS
ncbi:MAG: four helix bundle protein [Cytophagales bacterium]|nr:four helix bundle protein [Cytophagales bacterium]